MTFPAVPNESKTQINLAGTILVSQSSTPEDLEKALDLADRWRACHAYPINTFQALMRTILKNQGIVAQRLKRMPTIITKLKLHPKMKLTTMQDIGGLRAILESVQSVYKFADYYRNSKSLNHELINEKDYIQNPRDEDGYRSLHLIYKYVNRQASGYNGLRIEMQIRTKLQHIWATAVETMGTILDQALKSRLGDRKWLDFFAITSSAFAHLEDCKPVPRYKDLSRNDTFDAVAEAEQELQALTQMRALSRAVESISKKTKKDMYHLIVLNSFEKTVSITPYTRQESQKALADYAKYEAIATQGKRIEPVLVAAGPISKLRSAYPNFFLDISEFIAKVDSIIHTKHKQCGTMRI